MNIFEQTAERLGQRNFDNLMPFREDSPQVEENVDMFEQAAKNIPEKFSFLETVRDVGEQIVSKGAAGFVGSYGNILQPFGLQTQENLLPGHRAALEKEFEDPLKYGVDDDILPRYSRLPTSQEARQGIQAATGIGEGKTPAGRVAGRGSEFVGEALAIPGSAGAKTLATLGGAGIAGQTARELGAPEAVATGIEIAGSILPSVIEGRLAPRGGEASDLTKAGRAIGLTEKQITPLVQSERKIATLGKIAKKSEDTKELFSSIKQSLGDSYQNIKSSVSKMGRVNNTNRDILEKGFLDIRNELSKTLKASPDKEAAIKFIDDAISKINTSGATPEELINFWQDINRSVNWNSIQGGKKSLSQLKEPILEVLNNVAPAAAKDFEMTNQLYSKYAQISRKLKPDIIDAFVNKAEIMGAIPSALALATGNPWMLYSLGTEISVRLLATEMLTNPYFQNLATKLVKNIDQGSVKATTELMKNAKEFMSRKYPDESWDFMLQE